MVSQTNIEHEEIKLVNMGFNRGLFDDVDIRDAKVSLKMWANELLNNMEINISPETAIYETNNELIKAINKNLVDLISLPIVDYLRIKDEVKLKPSIITMSNKKIGYNFVLVVRKDRKINTIKDLKNRIINIPSNSFGLLTKMWLATSIQNENERYDIFFNKVNKYDKPAQILLPVFFKQADACILPKTSFNTLIELNPQLDKELIVIKESPVFVNGIMCLNSSIDESLIEPIIRAIKNLSTTSSGKQILALFKSDGVIEYDEKHLEETENIYNKFNAIK